jgi:hypothetical protein
MPTNANCRLFVQIGVHRFTILDVARVRRGVHRASCKHCNGYARVLSGKTGRPQAGRKCDDCAASQARLRILEAHMKKEGML